jgi:hypothetical protein
MEERSPCPLQLLEMQGEGYSCPNSSRRDNNDYYSRIPRATIRARCFETHQSDVIIPITAKNAKDLHCPETQDTICSWEDFRRKTYYYFEVTWGGHTGPTELPAQLHWHQCFHRWLEGGQRTEFPEQAAQGRVKATLDQLCDWSFHGCNLWHKLLAQSSH